MSWNPSAPYNELPPLPPAESVETVSVLKATIEARAALAALDQAAQRVPNPNVLLNAIPLLEAQASSEIENIVTTTDDLFRYADGGSAHASPETKETLRYRAAIFAGVELIRDRPLTARTAAEVCSVIHDRVTDVRSLPGTIIANPMTREAIYTPPSGARVIRDKLDAWTRFIHEATGIDPLVRMALAHYQFEAIHPFADGNGRTGRILNILILIELGLLSAPFLYLSRHIIANKDEYYRLLLGVTRDGLWEEWVLFMLEAVRATASTTLRKIDRIARLQQETRDVIRELGAGANSDLLDVLFEQPYCRIVNVVSRCGVSRPTATKWLNELVESRVLTSVKLGRERLFINGALLDLLVRDVVDEERAPTLF